MWLNISQFQYCTPVPTIGKIWNILPTPIKLKSIIIDFYILILDKLCIINLHSRERFHLFKLYRLEQVKQLKHWCKGKNKLCLQQNNGGAKIEARSPKPSIDLVTLSRITD